MFKKIIFSVLIATGFVAQGMDNRRNNDEKSWLESLKDVQTIEDQKKGEQVIDKVIQVNAPNKKPNNSAVLGQFTSLWALHPKPELHQQSKL